MSEIPPLSSSLYPQTNLSQSLHTDIYTGAGSTSAMPYPSTQTLLERLDQQNNVCGKWL